MRDSSGTMGRVQSSELKSLTPSDTGADPLLFPATSLQLSRRVTHAFFRRDAMSEAKEYPYSTHLPRATPET
jgi:hypothetical protein